MINEAAACLWYARNVALFSASLSMRGCVCLGTSLRCNFTAGALPLKLCPGVACDTDCEVLSCVQAIPACKRTCRRLCLKANGRD